MTFKPAPPNSPYPSYLRFQTMNGVDSVEFGGFLGFHDMEVNLSEMFNRVGSNGEYAEYVDFLARTYGYGPLKNGKVTFRMAVYLKGSLDLTQANSILKSPYVGSAAYWSHPTQRLAPLINSTVEVYLVDSDGFLNLAFDGTWFLSDLIRRGVSNLTDIFHSLINDLYDGTVPSELKMWMGSPLTAPPSSVRESLFDRMSNAMGNSQYHFLQAQQKLQWFWVANKEGLEWRDQVSVAIPGTDAIVPYFPCYGDFERISSEFRRISMSALASYYESQKAAQNALNPPAPAPVPLTKKGKPRKVRAKVEPTVSSVIRRVSKVEDAKNRVARTQATLEKDKAALSRRRQELAKDAASLSYLWDFTPPEGWKTQYENFLLGAQIPTKETVAANSTAEAGTKSKPKGPGKVTP